MTIIIEEKELSKRSNELRKNLIKINPNISIGRERKAACTTLYAKDQSAGNDSHFLVNTTNEHIKANYKEMWMLKDNINWELRKIYLKIVKKESYKDVNEILSFHLDLDEKKESYKKYPHIHIKHPKLECISNAHISLNLNDFDEVTKDLESIDRNIIKIIKMIHSEFIDKFKE